MPKRKTGKLKLVLDTNVFISALVFGGKPREILGLAVKGRVDVAVSDDILEEIKDVLGGDKFRYPKATLRALMREIEDLTAFVAPKERIEAVKEDPEDNRVLECAVESGASVIVSGDSHLLELQEFGGIKILRPDEFLHLWKRRQTR